VFCNPAIETMGRDEMTSLQTDKLGKLIKWLHEKSSFYRAQMEQTGLGLADIKTMTDLVKLPFTTEDDLVANYPYGMLTFPMSTVARLHTIRNSGRPIAVAYTSGDIGKWMEMLARTLVAGGVNPTTVFLVALDYGLSPAGLGMHYATELTGATVIPSGQLAAAEQFQLIEQYGVTALAAEPQYLLQLAAAAREMGRNVRELPLTAIFVVSDRLRNACCAEIVEQFGVNAIQIYSNPKLIGPGIAGGCPANGLHIQEDYFYPEIIHPVTGELLPDGEQGELVLTTLGKEAMPVVRYRTGECAALERGVCACGRTLARLIIE